jgi:signal transduction histidine kinase/DNA-binding response OmpR family regulator
MLSIFFVENNCFWVLKNSFRLMRKKISFTLFLCLSIIISVKGQSQMSPAFQITSDTAAFLILPDTNWQVMADPGKKIQLEQAIASAAFQSNDQKINYKTHVYWQRFRLANNMAKEIKIALPESSFHADLFTKINNGEWEHYTTGTGVPWSRRDGLKRIPAFLIAIPPGGMITIYKRMYWNFIDSQPDSIKVSFSYADKLIEHNYVKDESHEMDTIQDTFLLGMFILSMVINFYFFLVVREKEFLYFTLFLLMSSILALCSLNDVFLRNSPGLILYLYIFGNSLSGFMLIQFVRHFLKTFQRFPRWDKYLLIFSFLQIFVILFSSFASAAFQTNLAKPSHDLENAIKLLYNISLLATLLFYIRDKERNIRLMLIALIPIVLLGATVYASFVVLGLYSPRLGAPDISGYTSEFNSAAFLILILTFFWMMAFFTWVLFVRFSNLRKEVEHQLTLDHLKSRFFTNISHEFRTPLTLIIGPVEDLLEDKNAQRFREPLQYIHRNSKRLLQLINQLLDLSKLNVGNYQVSTNRNDIIPFVKQIVHSFSSMAHRKNIMLETEVDPHLKNDLRNEVRWFYFDDDVFEKILTNLLSNSFKFTPDGGSIIVSMCLSDKNMFELKVEDTGTGIPAEKIPFIFDRFYQADDSYKREYEGTGIGLALVKELVELHKGTITVESKINKGTTFSCYFPFNKKILSTKSPAKISANQNIPQIIEETENDVNEENASDNILSRILIVEDQQDVRKYISNKLSDRYTVMDAKNGKEGFESAKQHIPDLVISDVMMPLMDGLELCHLLKTDDLTSHIPVILLTARAEDMDKLAGLETGADAYLIKPFNSKELLLRVHNLIELRNKLRKKFSGRLLVKPREITVTSRDSQFMQRLLDTVEKHISDEKFSIEQLGHEFGMSPSQINRKLKAIINQSAGAFIRTIRMERAMELLKNNQATIAEVAYETGFSEPAYFSRVFKNHFGYSPSDVKKEES